MPLTPSNGDRLHGPFTRLYRRVDDALWRHLATFLAMGRGFGRAWLVEAMLRRLRFQLGVTRIVDDAAQQAPGLAETAVTRAWRDGAREARADTGSRREHFDARAVRAILGRVQDAIDGMHRHIPVHADRVYRTVATEAAQDSDEQSRRTRALHALRRFARQGFTGLIDPRGRRRELVTYAEQTIRGAVSAAEVDGYCQQAVADGFDLFIVSDVPGACELCRPHEGRIYSITGSTVGAISRDTITGAPIRVNVAGSLAGARADGLFHYGCRHTIRVWTPDDPVPPRAVRATPEQRAARRAATHAARQQRTQRRIAIVQSVLGRRSSRP